MNRSTIVSPGGAIAGSAGQYAALCSYRASPDGFHPRRSASLPVIAVSQPFATTGTAPAAVPPVLAFSLVSLPARSYSYPLQIPPSVFSLTFPMAS
ncbi:MAG: hypothetical protein DIJKHBIC_00548 [Thermoanaerobaculia bacterium]|nr:hypothetical protein [Thermoanaerobaculia bacterium]